MMSLWFSYEEVGWWLEGKLLCKGREGVSWTSITGLISLRQFTVILGTPNHDVDAMAFFFRRSFNHEENALD
jgi:hypothetical protein